MSDEIKGMFDQLKQHKSQQTQTIFSATTKKGYILNNDICIICGVCLSECPTQAIKEDGDRLVLDNKLCNKCNACVEVCPVEAIS